jgi:hypothetical protein
MMDEILIKRFWFELNSSKIIDNVWDYFEGAKLQSIYFFSSEKK